MVAIFAVLIASLPVAAQTSVRAPVPPRMPAAPPPLTGLGTPRFLIVLDAAHGGDDSGGKLATQPEKDFTLALSVRLRSLLSARGLQVITTRESDSALDPGRRAEVANHANAQACLSLHASESGAGIHLFASSLAPAQANHVPAWKTAQSAWITRSLALAGVLNSVLLHDGFLVTLGRTALPTIDSMTCPAIAIEISPGLAADGKSKVGLDDPAYQARIAESIAAALLEWKTTPREAVSRESGSREFGSRDSGGREFGSREPDAGGRP